MTGAQGKFAIFVLLLNLVPGGYLSSPGTTITPSALSTPTNLSQEFESTPFVVATEG